MRKNVAGQHVAFQMNATSNGAAVTTGTPTVYYTIDAGTQATGGGTATHEGQGQWSYAPTQAETNGNHVAFTMVLTNAITQTVNVWPVGFDSTAAQVDANVTQISGDSTAADNAESFFDGTGYAGTNNVIPTVTNLTNLPAITSNWLTAAGIAASALDGKGDWNTTTPPTAAAVRSEIDSNSTQLAAIVADTNELQADWANGGRLDLILDARASQASVDTVDSNVDAILVDTGTTLDGKIDTIDTVVDGIKAVTDLIPDSGAMSSIATAANLATVDSNVDDLKLGIITGQAQTGTLSTTQASTNLTGYADDQLIGRAIVWTSGNCDGEATDITDYASTNGVLTFTALTTAPANGDTFKIV